MQQQRILLFYLYLLLFVKYNILLKGVVMWRKKQKRVLNDNSSISKRLVPKNFKNLASPL